MKTVCWRIRYPVKLGDSAASGSARFGKRLTAAGEQRPDQTGRKSDSAGASEPSTFVQGRWPLQHSARKDVRLTCRPRATGVPAKMLDNGGGCPLEGSPSRPCWVRRLLARRLFQQPAICGLSVRLRHGAKKSTASKSATALSVGWRVVELVVVIEARLVLLR
jgi:hypothetical protein